MARDKERDTLRRHAKALSAGATESASKSRARFAALLALAICALAVVASPAGAVPPTVSMGPVSEVSYTSAHVKGEVDAHAEEVEWFFQISTDAENWENTNVTAVTFGTDEVEGDLTGLKPGTTYFVRLYAFNYTEGSEAATPAPYAEFTAKTLPAPTLAIDPVSAFTATTAHFSGHIDPNPPAGTPAASDVRWHFQCTPECPGIGNDQEVLAGAGNTEVEVDASGLEPNTDYEVELIGANAGGPVSAGPVSFKTDAAAPSATTIPAVIGAGGSISLGGRINAHNSATHYWVEYGPTAAYGTSVPLSKDASAGSGGSVQTFTQAITSLTANTTYHFQVAAENSTGKVEGGDLSFTTLPDPSGAECPNAAIRAAQQSGALPACRAYELVSRGDGNFGDVLRVLGAADDGGRVAYDAAASTDLSDSSLYMSSSVSSRSPSGWTSVSSDPVASAVLSGDQRLVQPLAISSDFSKLLMYVTGDLSTEDGDHGGNDLYLIDVGTGAATPISLGETRPDTFEGSAAGFVGASRDLSHIYFRMNTEQLLAGASGFSIYEWNQGQLEVASKLPGGLVTDGLPGAGPHGRSGIEALNDIAAPLAHGGPHGVSDHGSTFFWTSFPDLYARRDGASVQVNASQRTGGAAAGATFAGATHDGNSVYFFSDGQLTENATSGGGLYRYELSNGGLELLTPDAGPGGLGVSDIMMSDDASHLYFLATAALAPGAEAGVPNLYVYSQGKTRFLFTVSGGGTVQRASRDGRFAVIQTTTSLGDASVNGHQALYEYDDQTGLLGCVSCRADGSPSQGDATLDDTAPALLGQFPQMSSPRNIADDGRIFFASTDRLVPRDATGSPGYVRGDVHSGADVYEYANGSVSLLTTGHSQYDSFVADSGDDGRDAFIVTRSSLVAEDEDEDLADIYDVRIDGGFASSSHSRVSCGDGCQHPAGSPGATGVGSTALEGDGNAAQLGAGQMVVSGWKSTNGAILNLKVKVGGAGKVELSGPDVLKRSRTVTKAGTYSLRATLDSKAMATLQSGDAVKTAVTLVFHSSEGMTTKKLTVNFKPPRPVRSNGGR
jgi:hypothetical protein